MSVAEIAARARGRHRIIGTHWWNPPFLIPLVEWCKRPTPIQEWWRGPSPS
ncbi:MAG: 3-hydroxyacyl-CoA dehydrogenase NAD-binding domain-containing protein [Solirubrobacteraceae bacterium]